MDLGSHAGNGDLLTIIYEAFSAIIITSAFAHLALPTPTMN
jgi:hypothetical protein